MVGLLRVPLEVLGEQVQTSTSGVKVEAVKLDHRRPNFKIAQLLGIVWLACLCANPGKNVIFQLSEVKLFFNWLISALGTSWEW